MNDVETGHVGRGNDIGSETFRTQLSPLLLIASIFLLNFTARIIAAPLLPTIEKDLGFSHGDAGSLFLFLSIGYFISLLGSGHISSRITHRKTIAVSAIAVGAALSLLSFSKTLFTMRCCVFLLGISAGIYLPSGITTVTSLVKPRHWGKAVAIHELAPNLSFILTPLLAEILLHWFIWRNILFFVGIVSVIVGMVFPQLGKGGNFSGEAPNFSSIKKILEIPAFWILIVLFSLAITSTLGIYNMLPLYLVTEHGMSLDWANSLVGTSRISTLGMAFLGGWATDRFGSKPIMIGVFFVTGILTVLIGMVSTYWIAAVVFLQPVLAVCFYPAGFAALSTISTPENRNMAISLTIPVAFVLGGGVVPALIGIMADNGYFSWGITLSGAMIMMGFFLLFFLKLSHSR
ncbi:MAG: MFS transporter [Deltaproteobacteria bacterium]|nr:MFS transporter [Deltaproteobacteria bacterium]MBW2012621.1 MFS transporter [Deltaproteobacteria bacterium]MBW2087462.1 MFS transporter [Deltaproteobacteria bacterium]